MTVAERYENLKLKVVSRREEFLKFMEFVETETEYLTAPASTKFHLCREGGLLEHSVNVAETLLKIKNTLAAEILDESCVIVGLLHDLGKADRQLERLCYRKKKSVVKFCDRFFCDKIQKIFG